MKNKKILLLIAILLCVLMGVIIFINANIQVGIRKREYKKVGDNLYYTDELIENKGRDKDTVLYYYQIISEYIKENFACDIYISNLSYDVNEMYFNGYQMIDEVIIVDTFFTMTIKNNKVLDFYSVNGYNCMNESAVDTNGLLSVEKIKETASKLAKENADTMLEASNTNVIKGEIYLEYDKVNALYYKVVLNNGSYIKINARTGNVIDTYFFNGIIF